MEEQQQDGPKVRKRKIKASDWQKVEDFIKKELKDRQENTFRKSHEKQWKEVDRQVAMEPMMKYGKGGKELPPSWQSAFELGELSKASEVTTAAVMRLTFPFNRTYFEAHCKPPMTVDQRGKAVPVANQTQQELADGIQRALMSQQQMDFGFKQRVELSVKEALHHGSFVATVEWETQNKVYDGQGLESLSAPVWVPHSMWNCYPDMSPMVVSGANIFYPGSMMIVSYMPRHKVLALKGENYMNLSPSKIPKRKNQNKDVDTEDVEIVTYYGDLVIPREDGDIYLPNSKCKTANGVVIYYAPNELPFPEVIYVGYERQDIRDPYATSPLIKNSPMQKLATILSNRFVDSVEQHTEPPIVYDGNDPYMVQNGGPDLFPGAKTPSKGSGKFQQLTVGDPKVALMGVQFCLQKIEEGTGVNAIRAGASDSDRKTATEIRDTQQGAELRTADFVDKLERAGLRPFLYMQHELNLKNLKDYSFYCPEKGLPDFITVKNDDLPKVVHFEVVGSKGVLGEERRRTQMTAVTAFAAGSPLFAGRLNADKILIDMYEDAGVKGAEMYLKNEENKVPPEVQQQMQQLQQAAQQLQQELMQEKQGNQAKVAEVQQKYQLAMQQFQAEQMMNQKRLAAEQAMAAQEMDMQRRQSMMDAAFDRYDAKLKAATSIAVARITARANESSQRASGAS